jgi:hypothetical protein
MLPYLEGMAMTSFSKLTEPLPPKRLYLLRKVLIIKNGIGFP